MINGDEGGTDRDQPDDNSRRWPLPCVTNVHVVAQIFIIAGHTFPSSTKAGVPEIAESGRIRGIGATTDKQECRIG